jgi:uncharacterized membrane protein
MRFLVLSFIKSAWQCSAITFRFLMIAAYPSSIYACEARMPCKFVLQSILFTSREQLL